MDWFKLIERSGPFLSEAVLNDALPSGGLEDVGSNIRKRVRSTYEEWQREVELNSPDLPLIHDAWVSTILAELLEFDVDVMLSREDGDNTAALPFPEHGVDLVPDRRLVAPTDKAKILLAIDILEPGVDPEDAVTVGGWVTSPLEKMVRWLRGKGCPLGLITNGEQWRLVYARPDEPVSIGTWYARLWLQELETLRAFATLLRLQRFFGSPENKLDQLFERSKESQDEVTDALGDQVARAIEVLVRSLDKADEERNRELLSNVAPQDLYEAGLTVMMRLVFLLAAEERGLLLLGEPKYDSFYAVTTLRRQLRKKSEERLDHEFEAWARLLSLFRMVFGGVEHPSLRMPALGSSLFDPDRFPFLEGRSVGSKWREDPATPLPINDQTVLLLLDAIQIFRGRTISYKGLDVEQIGHVYEGLLEKTVRRLDKTTLQLKSTKGAKDPFITLNEIVGVGNQNKNDLIELIAEKSGKKALTIKNDLDREHQEASVSKLLSACNGDEEIYRQIVPYSNCIELDAWGYPLVHPGGAFVVGLGQDRRQTGSHYTPKRLTEKIVEETLTPIVFVGPADGLPKSQWSLKSPSEILDLKVCDPAMGSGAFLVQVCRLLSERLLEAWIRAEQGGTAFGVDGNEKHNEGAEPLPKGSDDRLMIAKRLIAEKCLYGVDLNPLAVELAKLSLWLTTLAKGQPFGFLDHNLRVGNSLLGITSLDQITNLSMTPKKAEQGRLFGRTIKKAVDEAIQLRIRLRNTTVRDVRDIQAMEALDSESSQILELPLLLADALTGIELAYGNQRAINEQTEKLAIFADEVVAGNFDVEGAIRKAAVANLAADEPIGNVRQPFHWPLQFPEVFNRKNSGFDAFVGNPPFVGGQKIREGSGAAFRDFIVRNIAEGRKGSADLVAYFFLQTFELLREDGGFGLLAVNTISDGDTRQVGLESMLKGTAVIHAAYPNEAWPGKAAVVTSRVHVHKGKWSGQCFLLGMPAPYISAFLSDREEWSPRQLVANQGIAFQGSIVLGKGFVLELDEAQRMLDADPNNKDVLFPYLNGEDLNSHPEQKPSRWVINFWDWPKDRAAEYTLPFEHIEKYVKPVRWEKKSDGDYKQGKDARENWWLHLRARPALYHAIGRGEYFEKHPVGWSPEAGLERVLVNATQASKYANFSFLTGPIIFSNAIGVIATGDFYDQVVLSSSIHNAWAFNYGGRLKTDLRYAPTDCFENFPFPDLSKISINVRALHDNRLEVMRSREEGLTKLYNNIHNAHDQRAETVDLRNLWLEIDVDVAAAYGWSDLDLQHDFHKVPYLPESDNVRFTISEQARLEILNRLVDLNKQRHEEEVAQGLHEKDMSEKKKTKTSPPKSPSKQSDLVF